MKTGLIRLACQDCDREDQDGIDVIPEDWEDVLCVQSLERSLASVPPEDTTHSVLDWYTHLGTCPECQEE